MKKEEEYLRRVLYELVHSCIQVATRSLVLFHLSTFFTLLRFSFSPGRVVSNVTSPCSTTDQTQVYRTTECNRPPATVHPQTWSQSLAIFDRLFPTSS